MQKVKPKPIKMKKRTAVYIGFLLTTSSIIVILVFLFYKNNPAMKPMFYLGVGLAFGSLLIRNLLRFKPDWFKDNDSNETNGNN